MTGVNAMLSGEMELEGEWLDLTAKFRAHERGESTSDRSFVKTHKLKLNKQPCWEHLDDEQYRKQVQDLVDLIAGEAATMHANRGSQPVGVDALKKLRQTRRRTPSVRPSRSCTRGALNGAGDPERDGVCSSRGSSQRRLI